MDWNLYFLLSFIIGVLSGFQGIYERYKRGSVGAALTPPGIFYLFSRGLIPALIFIWLYSSHVIENKFWMYSLACGAGAEAILRIKFYIKKEQKDSKDLLIGLFDLIRFYQNYFLETISDWLAESDKKFVKKFVKKHVPQGVKFLDLCDRVWENSNAYPNPPAGIKELVERLKAKFGAEITEANTTTDLDRKYCFELAYGILHLGGRRVFRTLLTS